MNNIILALIAILMISCNPSGEPDTKELDKKYREMTLDVSPKVMQNFVDDEYYLNPNKVPDLVRRNWRTPEVDALLHYDMKLRLAFLCEMFHLRDMSSDEEIQDWVQCIDYGYSTDYETIDFYEYSIRQDRYEEGGVDGPKFISTVPLESYKDLKAFVIELVKCDLAYNFSYKNDTYTLSEYGNRIISVRMASVTDHGKDWIRIKGRYNQGSLIRFQCIYNKSRPSDIRDIRKVVEGWD